MTFKYHSVIACTCVISSCRLVTRSEDMGNVNNPVIILLLSSVTARMSRVLSLTGLKLMCPCASLWWFILLVNFTRGR